VNLTRDSNDRITRVELAFKAGYTGRDLGLGMTARGTNTATAGGTASAFTVAGAETAGTRSVAVETISGIEKADLTFESQIAGFADVAGWTGSVKVTGSERSDHVTLGADDSAALGEGNDYLTLTGAGALAAGVVLDGGEGFDRLIAQTPTQVLTLTDATISFGSGATVNHAAFEDYILLGSSGADVIDASGLGAGELTADTRLSTLNAGAGLPIRFSDNEIMEVVNRDSDGDAEAPVVFDNGERAYDVKVIHGDGTEDYVDIFGNAETMQDVLDAFNAVARNNK